MNTIERLKQLEEDAKEAADSDYDNQIVHCKTIEHSIFSDKLIEIWPKLLALVEAAKTYFTYESVDSLNPKYFPNHYAVRKALEALEEDE